MGNRFLEVIYGGTGIVQVHWYKMQTMVVKMTFDFIYKDDKFSVPYN